jgi:hypothetical protein
MALDVSKGMEYAIGAVILVSVIVALAPTVFTDLASSNFTDVAPTWVSTVLPIIIGAGFVFLLWRMFAKKQD